MINRATAYVGLICSSVALADEFRVAPPDPAMRQRALSLPYAFYSDLFGAAGGYVYDVAGFPQQQSTILVTAMLGSAGSGMVFVMGTSLCPASTVCSSTRPSQWPISRAITPHQRQSRFSRSTGRQQRLQQGQLHYGKWVGRLLARVVQAPAAHRPRPGTRLERLSVGGGPAEGGRNWSRVLESLQQREDLAGRETILPSTDHRLRDRRDRAEDQRRRHHRRLATGTSPSTRPGSRWCSSGPAISAGSIARTPGRS